MSRSYYEREYGGDTQDYYSSPHPPPPRPQLSPPSQSRLPRPAHAAPDRIRNQPPPPMRPAHAAPSPWREPRWTPEQQQIYHGSREQPQYYAPDDRSWDNSHLYDGSGYDYEVDYGREDQWPLPTQSQAPTSPARSSPRKPPQRPRRPDERVQTMEFEQRIPDQPRYAPRMAVPSDRNFQSPPPQPVSHHGSRQWTSDGYSYAPPPNYPLPQRPAMHNPESSSGLPSLPAFAPPYPPQQMAYGQANRRPPLGPPPSARRGPAHYYPQVGPVHPIVEETDSMRGSARMGSVQTGHESKASFASSNAIPIGISQMHLDHGRDASYVPSRYPEVVSESIYDDDEDPPTEPAFARGEILTPDPTKHHASPSPEGTVFRQASLGKKSRPILTTVKSGEKSRKRDSVTESHATAAGIASLPSQRAATVRTVSADDYRVERSRALTQEMLEGQAQPGAASALSEDSHTVPDVAAVGAAATYLAETSFPREDVNQTPEHEEQASDERPRSGADVPDTLSSADTETENALRRKRSKELLGSELTNQLYPHRSSPRSPLAPAVDPRVESIIGSLGKGGALSPEDAQQLKQPMSGFSDERTGKRRPPRLDVDAVREAEARGSLTSLSDLIRRATKLASNLDRGKTASRLGMNWFDGAEEGEKRRSGLQDILASFPPPHATPTGSRNERRSLTTWPSHMRHSALPIPSVSDPGEAKQKKRCCGMPRWVFITLLALLFLLIAAAVVVPVVLLVVVPDNNDNGSPALAACEKQLTCQNGGTNILSSSGNCECLCVNGYTGLTCGTLSHDGCTTTSIGSINNATVGEAIPRLLTEAQSSFSIPLNPQELLGLFSSSDVSCNIQNNLVTFNGVSSKRSPSPTIKKRQGTTSSSASDAATSDGLIFATGTPTPTSYTTSATPSSTPSATGTSTSTNSTTFDFARVAVLYIFQASHELQTAADAQDSLQTYFRNDGNASSSDASNVSLGNGYTADLTQYIIRAGNGTTVGG